MKGMQNTKKDQFVQETLNLAQLEGELHQFQLGGLHQSPGNEIPIRIEAPEEATFRAKERILKTVKGFTPGASC